MLIPVVPSCAPAALYPYTINVVLPSPDTEEIEMLYSSPIIPVSYTHLDVYKRQVSELCKELKPQRIVLKHIEHTWDTYCSPLSLFLG